MANVTLINCRGNDPRFTAMRRQHEPAQFLGMTAALKRARHRVAFIDAHGEDLGARQTAKAIVRSEPDIVGINGYLDRWGRVLEFDAEVLGRVRDARPAARVVIGGAFTSHPDPRRAVVKALAPDFAVVGEGEIPMEALAAADFNPASLEGDERIKAEKLEGATVLRARRKVDLDSVEIERPPEWPGYILTSLDWQRGCLEACTFCAGLKTASTYKSPARAAEELRYLTGQGKRRFFLIGPEFLADTERATAIVDELNRQNAREIDFAFEARVDSFAAAMKDHREVWAHFGDANALMIYLGYESGNPQRLASLGKVRGLEEGRRYLPALLDVLEQEYPFNIFIAWMLIDHQSTPSTVLFDLLVMQGLLAKYSRLDMNLPSVLNNMSIVPGMPLYGRVTDNWPETLPGPVKELRAFMDRVEQPRKPGAIGRLIGRAISSPSRAAASRYSPNSFIVNVLRERSRRDLAMLTRRLIEGMSKSEAGKMKSEVYAVASMIGDERVSALLDGQWSGLKIAC